MQVSCSLVHSTASCTSIGWLQPQSGCPCVQLCNKVLQHRCTKHGGGLTCDDFTAVYDFGC